MRLITHAVMAICAGVGVAIGMVVGLILYLALFLAACALLLLMTWALLMLAFVSARLHPSNLPRTSPTCAESAIGMNRISGLAEKSALHFWCEEAVFQAQRARWPNWSSAMRWGSTIPRRSSSAACAPSG